MAASFPIDPQTRQPWFYKSCRTLVRALARVYFRWRIHSAELVPLTGPIIIASNHVSYLDPPLVGSALPRSSHFLARKTLFQIPGFGGLIRLLNAVPVDREGSAGAGLNAVLDLLSAGCAVILFPEGTRSVDGNLGKGRAGIGLTVIKSGARVVPVRIDGAFEACGRHQRFPRSRRIDVRFAKPLDFSRLQSEAETCDKARLKAIYQEIADEVMWSIAALRAS